MKHKLISLMLCLCMMLSFEGIVLAAEVQEPECEIAEVEIDGNVYYLTCETKVAVKVGGTFVANHFKVTNSAGNRYPELEKEVTVTSDVNTQKVGNYQIEYELDGVSITQNAEVSRQVTSANLKQDKDEEGELQLVLVGEEVTNATLNENFCDYGAQIVTEDGEVCEDLNAEITVSGKVDTSKAGIYILKYEYKDMTAERIVNMCRVKALLDGQILFFELNGLSEMQVQKGEKFVDPGCKVTNTLHNVYSKLGSKVTVSGKVDTDKVGDYIIKYKFANVTLARLVHVTETVETSKDEPTKTNRDISYKMSLAGKKISTVKQGETFKDQGVWVLDEDGNICLDKLGEVIVEGQVNTSKAGKYTLTYKFENMTIKRVFYVVSQSGEDVDAANTGTSESSGETGDSGDNANPNPGGDNNPGGTNPDDPDTPDNPNNPDTPDTPDKPDKPDIPDKPEKPKPDEKPNPPDEPETPPIKPPTDFEDGGIDGPGDDTTQVPGGDTTEPEEPSETPDQTIKPPSDFGDTGIGGPGDDILQP